MTVYTEKALKKIIIENINDKHIVSVASKLYIGWLTQEDWNKLETELTGLLINKKYEVENEGEYNVEVK